MKRIARLKQTIAFDIITIIAWLCLLSIASVRITSDIATVEKTARFWIAIAVAALSLFWIIKFVFETRKDFKELKKAIADWQSAVAEGKEYWADDPFWILNKKRESENK